MKMLRTTGGAMVAAVALAASPAFADEARVEVRGGIISVADTEEATAGIAAGYDFDLNDTFFVGAEVSADKVLVDDSDIYVGLTGRVGAHLSKSAKLFLAGGYTVGEGEDVPHLGGGLEYNLTERVYLKGEYRHFFSDFDDADSFVAGVGLKF
jgi:opacity protein-like surface antigen